MPVQNANLPSPSSRPIPPTTPARGPTTTSLDNQAVDGIYVHVPFCEHPCDYCSFAKVSPHADRLRDYPGLIAAEMAIAWPRARRAGGRARPRTLYIGGGSPPLLGPASLRRLIRTLRSHINTSRLCEFTVEVNLQHLAPALIDGLIEEGVTRLSIGWQSPFASMLVNLGRRAPARLRSEALDLLSRRVIPFNLDIIYGVPGMTAPMLARTLEVCLEARPSHISAYELSLSTAHPFYRFMPDEDSLCAMHESIRLGLTRAGYTHYEISNYALPGFCSQHNMQYWTCKNILGLGLSAHSSFYLPADTAFSHARCVEWTNARTWAQYCHQIRHPETHPRARARAAGRVETRQLFIIAHFRTAQGLPRAAYQAAFGRALEDDYGRALGALIDRKLILKTDAAYQLSPRGRLLMDQVLSTLFESDAPVDTVNNDLPANVEYSENSL